MEELFEKVVRTLKDEGLSALSRKTKSYIKTRNIEKQAKNNQVFRDVLFINGCGEELPHPTRYRVTHQREQLEYYGMTSSEVFFKHLSLDMVRLYRTFVFFRCPYTEEINEFILKARELNKKVFYDVDDLVIDTEYTDQIPYLDTMSMEERKAYDDNVRNMGKLLKMCDAAITSTTHLQIELKKFVPEILINRNTASEEMGCLSEKALRLKKSKSTVDIGYFSGSITHNDDFEMILPVIIEVMTFYQEVRLHLVGELDLPPELLEFQNRIIIHPFVDWKKLPELIAEVDINLAPLTDTLFNKAKSENKWVEAALVKVPTIASDLGAFKEKIVNEKTGILCTDIGEWKNALITLIENSDKRKEIAEAAYQYCKQYCMTYKKGFELVDFLRKHLKKNMLIVLPSFEISGGIMVALTHAKIMQKRGYDVSLACINAKIHWYGDNQQIPVLLMNDKMLDGEWDIAVATMWSTLKNVIEYPKIKKRCYLVQNYETDFYQIGDPLRRKANETYAVVSSINYLTISKWCQNWLKKEFGQECKYVPNGIEYNQFYNNHNERKFDRKKKIRILIEGDCGSYYKNVDESFKIINELDKDKYEIWYMSYNAEPKEWYRVDRFLHKIPYEKVAEVYQECDILLKTSILESFSYPPLEMMATGGMVVAVPNGGNEEYLVSGENCLMYKQGDIEEAVKAIETLCSDEVLRHQLYVHGLETAEKREWSLLEEKIEEFYTED